MPAVQLKGIRKLREGRPVLKGVDLCVEEGELLVLVGPSGCGKTTLLRLIAGLEEIDGGELHIGGRLANELSPKDRDVAMVFQSYALYPHMTVFENLAFALTLKRVPKAEIRVRVEEVTAMLGLSETLGRKPSQLSGGQQQRVAMGRAIVRRPKVFLFDEPLSNLDAGLRSQMRAELLKLHAALRATMVYVTHDQVEAMTLADRMAVMRSGELIQIGEPMELFRRPAHRFVGEFLGLPPMNMLPSALSSDGRTVGGEGFSLPLGPGWPASGQNVFLGIRPHDLRLDAGPQGFLARVEVVEPLGMEAFVHLRVGGSRIIARTTAQAGTVLRLGQELRVAVSPEAVHLFDAATERALDPRSVREN